MWRPTDRTPERPSPYYPAHTAAVRREWTQVGDWLSYREEEPQGSLHEALTEYLSIPDPDVQRQPPKIREAIRQLTLLVYLKQNA